METKICVDCKLPKSATDDFYVKEVRRHSVRRTSRCKPCYSRWVRRPNKTGRPPQKRLTATQRRARHRARQAIANAVYRGTLVKPSACQRCGTPTQKDRLEGHHHKGYDHPLDVLFVCRECHMILG